MFLKHINFIFLLDFNVTWNFGEIETSVSVINAYTNRYKIEFLMLLVLQCICIYVFVVFTIDMLVLISMEFLGMLKIKMHIKFRYFKTKFWKYVKF